MTEFQNVNVDRLRFRGVEISGSARLGRDVILEASYTHLDAENLEDPQDPVADVYRNKGTAGFTWSEPRGRFWGEYRVRLQGRREQAGLGASPVVRRHALIHRPRLERRDPGPRRTPAGSGGREPHQCALRRGRERGVLPSGAGAPSRLLVDRHLPRLGRTRGRRRWSRGISAAVLLLLSSCTSPSPGAPVARGFFALHGQGHATPASRFLAHEVIVAGWTRDPAVRGLEAALAVLRWDSVVGARTELTTLEARGDTVVLGAMLHRSRLLTGLGVGEVLRLPGSRLVVHDGLIHAIDLAPLDEASRRAYDEAMSASSLGPPRVSRPTRAHLPRRGLRVRRQAGRRPPGAPRRMADRRPVGLPFLSDLLDQRAALGTVYGDAGPGDQAGPLRGEEGHHVGHLLGPPEAPQREVGFHERLHALRVEP